MVIFIFSVGWPFFLKSGRVPQKIFFPISPKMLLFSKKLLDEKIFKTSFRIKRYIHFQRQMPLSVQKRLGPQKRVFAVFSEDKAFFEKTAK